MAKNFRQQSVNVHQFAMVPRSDVPRSSFRMQKGYKTTFDAGYLIPVLCEEVLPGDTYNCRMTVFARMATLLFPLMDNVYLDSFFFFIPNRLVWDNWQRFMGEQDTPGASISYLIPQGSPTVGGYPSGSIFDYFGLPIAGQILAGNTLNHSVLPLRGYNLVYNQWFRDENLQTPAAVNKGDGPDAPGTYALLRRGKRHDYFTSALPFLQKGTAVPLPLGTSAPLVSTGAGITYVNAANTRFVNQNITSGSNAPTWTDAAVAATSAATFGPAGTGITWANVDLTTATAATINQIRQSFQIQKLLERDARGGTRYIEILQSHFGVRSPDARLQRPEYLGGGSTAINTYPVPDTTGTVGPVGDLSAYATALGQGHGFTQSFVEHGYVLGLVSVRADLTYQQGQRRHWNRRTRYDFYFPVFAMLGEQAILNKEIYATGAPGTDDAVFGYQERWAEYRYLPSEITGKFKSRATGTIDPWHLSQNFGAVPTLNGNFIVESPPISRVVAAGALADGQQFLADLFFDIKAARPLPLYSVPGLVDHF